MSSIKKWSEESTRDFIQLRFKLRHLFNGKKHQCEQAYGRIVKELGLSNNITAVQARKKWSNLKQKYMDIKGGCSTATTDWTFYGLMDQVIPLMHKEKLENAPPSTLSLTIINPEDGCISSTNSESRPSISKVTSVGLVNKTLPMKREPSPPESAILVNCDTEIGNSQKQKDYSEPPYKKGRTRKAALQARDNWWGAVEDPFDILPQQKVTSYNGVSYEATQLELRSIKLLESCSNSLNDIKDQLGQQTKQHNKDMKSLGDTVASQGNTITGLLTTISQQNNLIVELLQKNYSNSINLKGTAND